jgi:hypothetical protein
MGNLPWRQLSAKTREQDTIPTQDIGQGTFEVGQRPFFFMSERIENRRLPGHGRKQFSLLDMKPVACYAYQILVGYEYIACGAENILNHFFFTTTGTAEQGDNGHGIFLVG